MDYSQRTDVFIDELRQIRLDARQCTSVDELRHYFERVQSVRRMSSDDFDLQLLIADVQEQIVDRARALRQEGEAYEADDRQAHRAVSPPNGNANTTANANVPGDVQPVEIPPEVRRVDHNTWKRAIYLAVLLSSIALIAFFYLIQTARKLNFPQPPSSAQPTGSPQTAKTGPDQNVANVAAPSTPTLRLYTDLVPGTVSIDDNEPQSLNDGELVLDHLAPGEHSLKLNGPGGDASFSFEISANSAPRVIGIPSASNAMAVLVSSQDGRGKLVTNVNDSDVTIDGNTTGHVPPDGLALNALGKTDHDLRVTDGKDRQRFVFTYTPAPALTVYVKSDPNAGTVVVTTGQDGADVYVNGKLYRRATDHGQLRIPNLKVGDYTIRVHKTGFADPPAQTVTVKKAEETPIEFTLQPQPVPQVATLNVRDALPGTTIFIDQSYAAAVGAEGTAEVSDVKPGEHTIELRRDQSVPKTFQRTFREGGSVSLSGPETALERVTAQNPAVTNPAPAPPVPSQRVAPATPLHIDHEEVRKGGGFVPYHVPQVPGHYTFTAATRKGGFLRRGGKLEWYAGYKDSDNYILFSLDGKHATVREVRDGKSTEVNRVPFSSGSNEWVTVDMSVRSGALDARVRSEDGGWTDIGGITASDQDFTKGKVGIYIPGNDEIAVSNFTFSPR